MYEKLILWINLDLAKNLPLTREFEPVYEWDSATKSFSLTQATKDGVLVWQSEALIKLGWNADLKPVKIRLCSVTRPQIKPDPNKLAQLLMSASVQPATPSQTPINKGV